MQKIHISDIFYFPISGSTLWTCLQIWQGGLPYIPQHYSSQQLPLSKSQLYKYGYLSDCPTSSPTTVLNNFPLANLNYTSKVIYWTAQHPPTLQFSTTSPQPISTIQVRLSTVLDCPTSPNTTVLNNFPSANLNYTSKVI